MQAMNAAHDQNSDEQFLKDIQVATLALQLDVQAPMVRPSLFRRVVSWFSRIGSRLFGRGSP